MTNLKLAFRALLKSPVCHRGRDHLPGALGIGANAAIFSLFDQVLHRPLPVADPASVGQSRRARTQGSASCNNAGGCEEIFSYPMFRDLERVQFWQNRLGGSAAVLEKAMIVNGQT